MQLLRELTVDSMAAASCGDASARSAPGPRAGAPKIRLMLVISNLEYGGAQRQVVELANNLDPTRVEVHVCSLSPYVPLASELAVPASHQHIVAKHAKFDVTVIARLARLLRQLRVDVVHGFLFDADVAARLAGRLARTPLVVASERNANYTMKRIQQRTYRLTNRCMDLVIANSRAGAEFHQNLLRVEAHRYRVVHNGVNTQKFSPRDREAARARLGLGVDEAVVGMFASFKRQKNHPLLFAAAKDIVTRVPRLRLLLVGDELYGGMHGSSDYKTRMQALIEELGLRPRCVLLGNRDDVEQIYPACDVTVLPSLFEGTPNVALESMASGVPVVATDVADNRLIVPDGQAGFIVPLGAHGVLASRLESLLLDCTLAQRLGVQARTWVTEEFSTRRLAEKTEQVYREWL